MRTIEIEYPETIPAILNLSPEMFEKEAKFALALKLVKEWALLHQEELNENWERASNDMPLNWIKPLR